MTLRDHSSLACFPRENGLEGSSGYLHSGSGGGAGGLGGGGGG